MTNDSKHTPKILDANYRWENGVEHHPMSEIIGQAIFDTDYNHNDDSFCWKHGGDGDNGESLMYVLDIFLDSSNPNARQIAQAPLLPIAIKQVEYLLSILESIPKETAEAIMDDLDENIDLSSAYRVISKYKRSSND